MQKKNLVIVNGTSLAGKTTVCRKLMETTPSSAWLDGDWCWMMNPSFVASEENRDMVDRNISFLLRSYLSNSQVSVVFLSWVLDHEFIFDNILSPLKDIPFDLMRFTLIASSKTIKSRAAAIGGCSSEWIDMTIARQDAYDNMLSNKIFVDGSTPDQICQMIKLELNL